MRKVAPERLWVVVVCECVRESELGSEGRSRWEKLQKKESYGEKTHNFDKEHNEEKENYIPDWRKESRKRAERRKLVAVE